MMTNLNDVWKYLFALFGSLPTTRPVPPGCVFGKLYWSIPYVVLTINSIFRTGERIFWILLWLRINCIECFELNLSKVFSRPCKQLSTVSIMQQCGWWQSLTWDHISIPLLRIVAKLVSVINCGESFVCLQIIPHCDNWLFFSGHIQSRIVYYLMNIHVAPRTIYLTRVSC